MISAPETLSNTAEEATGETSVRLQDFGVRVLGHSLLEGVNAELPAGKVSLIIGCSGVGKSVLLRVLAGEIRSSDSAITTTGSVHCEIEGTQPARDPSIGVVYQDFALFDEWSPELNVQFAADHTRASTTRSGTDLLEELHVPRTTRTTALSGGQKQRLALARTLAARPDVILYDEPTSGLDAITAQRVARLIHQTHEAHPRTSIIVTHDFTSLPRIADVIFVLDGERQTLREIPREQWGQLAGELKPPAERVPDPPPTVSGRVKQLAATAMKGLRQALILTSRAAEETVQLPLRILPLWRRPQWGLRYVKHFLGLVCGPSAWIYIAIAGLIIGFVATYFTFKFLPFAEYTEPLLIENLLSAIGFSLYRILVPVLATILIAARCGAAVASDIGGRSFGRQIEAMRTLGAVPSRYLLTGVLWAFLIGTPVLVGIGYAVAHVTSLVMFVATHPEHGPNFWQMHYLRQLSTPAAPVWVGTGWLLGKVLTCAVGIGLVSYRIAERPKTSTADVSRGITQAILWSTLFVLAVHFAFTFFEFEPKT